jgi:exportin-2 (importin alpha re-exporter)
VRLTVDNQEIVASLSPDNFVINNGVLATAHSIFAR